MHSTRYGTICGLTSNKPNFTTTCNDYIFEELYLEKIKEDKRIFYQRILSSDTSLDKHRIDIEITKKQDASSIQRIVDLPDVLEVYTSLGSKLVMILIGVIGVFLIVCKIGFSWIFLSLILLIFTMAGYGIYRYISKTPELILNQDGIKYKKQIIPWESITFSSYQRERIDGSKDSGMEYLIIDTLTGKYKIPSGDWSLTKIELGHYIELYKEKYRRIK